MPRTKFQNVVFTAIMAFFMVFAMTAYSIAVQSSGADVWDTSRGAERDVDRVCDSVPVGVLSDVKAGG